MNMIIPGHLGCFLTKLRPSMYVCIVYAVYVTDGDVVAVGVGHGDGGGCIAAFETQG